MVKHGNSSGSNIWTLAGAGDVKSIEQLLSSHASDDNHTSNKNRCDLADAPNKLGETAAHIAARLGHAAVLQLLHSHGAQLAATDNKGWTPAHHAASTGQLECLRALSSHGIRLRLDVKDKEGKTPLDVAKGDHTRKFIMAWVADSKAGTRQGGGRAVGGGRGGRGQGGGARGAGGRGSLDYHSNIDLVQQLKSQSLSTEANKGVGNEAEGQKKATPSSIPLSYHPLVDLPPLDPNSPTSSSSQCQMMPRCTFEETGFTPYGQSLGFPKRPKWKGVVKSAAELHRLEERSFSEWQARLNQGREGIEPPPPPVSFYEPRLEFWRQLWRVVEFSDIVIMIVDARNPLLHFSHSLVRHVIDERGLVPILVLNKSDLIPTQAAVEWKRFFEERYPGMTVVSGSTRSADGSGGRTGAGGRVERGTASAIMQAVLSTSLTRAGGARVSDLIGMDSVENVLEMARERATMTKRRPVQEEAQVGTQPPAPQTVEAKGQAASVGKGSMDEEEEEEEGEEGDKWDVKGTKMKKKLAKKKKRLGHASQLSTVKAVTNQSSVTSKSAQQSSAQQSSASQSDIDMDQDEDDEEEEEGESNVDDEEDELMDLEEEEMTEDPKDIQAQINVTSQDPGTRSIQPRGKKAKGANVVVCMVGEPNVGKSSTLNALLGIHRVAVSIHPGRTKHYQTIWMTDKLMLCDCPGLVFPRAGVSLPMQILFGSFPIARCRDPYSVVEYLAVRIWPRLHNALGLRKVRGDEGLGSGTLPPVASESARGGEEGEGEGEEEAWSVQEILDAVAVEEQAGEA